VRRKILWTSLALKDLLEIKEYIHRENPSAAKKEADKIKKATERLSQFPESGRSLKTLPTLREVISGNYHIFYRAEATQVAILRIYHGKRNIPFLP